MVDAGDVVIPQYKPQEWATIVQLMLNAARQEDLGEEGSPILQMAAWVRGYLVQKRVRMPDDGDWEVAAWQRLPFVRHLDPEFVYLSTQGPNGLARHILTETGIPQQGVTIAELLRTNGWERKNLNFHPNGDAKRTAVTWSFWRHTTRDLLDGDDLPEPSAESPAAG
jgi:hypothetical protein